MSADYDARLVRGGKSASVFPKTFLQNWICPKTENIAKDSVRNISTQSNKKKLEN